MKLIKEKPAENWMQAFPLGNKEMTCRVYGIPGKERIDLAEKKYLKLRDEKISRGKAAVGHLEISCEGETEIKSYQRTLDLTEGMIESSWLAENDETKCRAFVPKSHKIMVYEMTRQENNLNLHIAYVPEDKKSYINYNSGGVFFTSSLKGHILCGKAALSSNGFPRADESGIFIKNASKVTLFILLDTAEVEKKSTNEQAMLQLQMQMNRNLVNLESHQIEELAKGPKGNMQLYRRIEKRESKK